MSNPYDDSDLVEHLRDEGMVETMDEQENRYGVYETKRRVIVVNAKLTYGWEARLSANHGVWEARTTEAEALGALIIRLHREREKLDAPPRSHADKWQCPHGVSLELPCSQCAEASK